MTDFHLPADNHASWQGASQDSKFPVVVLPTARLTAVSCSANHVLDGLFVLFRPVAQGLLAAFVESTWHLGLTTDEGWLGPADDDELIPMLGPMFGPATLTSMVPDTYKLVSGQEYEFYFIQHPGLEMAKKIAEEIGGGSKKYGKPLRIKVGKGELKVPEEAASFIPKGHDLYKGWVLYRDMPHAACAGVERQIKRLQAHLGALRYLVGTSNMPYLPDVGVDADKSGEVNDGIFDVRAMSAVFRFQQDAKAGKAFKVDGAPHAAYVNETYDPVVDRGKIVSLHAEAEALKKTKKPPRKAPQPELDTYKSVQDTIARLKREAAGLQAGVETAGSEANSWIYLAGAPTGPGSWLPGEAAREPLTPDGVVDANTALHIKSWLDNRLRKPDPILVLMADNRGWRNWLRHEAAIALHAFDQIVKAMGFTHGISVNHTFRSALVDIGHAGYGRSARSIHKTGAAIDLGMTKFSQTVEAFPIVYTRELDGDRVWFRLYGPSNQPISQDPVKANLYSAALRGRLEELSRTADPLPRAYEGARAVAKELMRELDGGPTFFANYYKHTVRRWVYDAFDSEGGKDGPLVTCGKEASRRVDQHDDNIEALEAEEKRLTALLENPEASSVKPLTAELKQIRSQLNIARNERKLADQHRAEREKADALDPSARDDIAFLDITAMAKKCGLERIHSFRTGWAATTKSVKATDLANLAKLLGSAEKALAEHPQMEDVATISRKKMEKETTVERIDKEFVASWNEALKALKKEAPKSVRVQSPQVVITISHTEAKKADADKIAAKLRELGSKQLAAMMTIEGTPPVQTATAWAQYIDDRVKALGEAWTAMQTAPSDAKDKKTAKVPSKKTAPQSSTLVLQPIFERDFVFPEGGDLKKDVWFLPGDVIDLPAEGQPIGMEWWHFQLGSVLLTGERKSGKQGIPHKLWGDLLVEIGYCKEALRHGTSPELHHRKGIGYPDADLDQEKAY